MIPIAMPVTAFLLVASLLLALSHACIKPTSQRGLEYAAYQNNEPPAGFENPGYPSFDPTVYKKTIPVLTGVTSKVGFQGSLGEQSTVNPYGNSDSIGADSFVIDHRGYLRTPLTGNYTVILNPVDDLLLFWLGPRVYKGWTRSNAVLEQTSTGSTSGAPVSYTFDAPYNIYFAIRIMYANGGGDYSFNVTITGPRGITLLSPTTPPNGAIIQYGCHRGKKFRPWGNER